MKAFILQSGNIDYDQPMVLHYKAIYFLSQEHEYTKILTSASERINS